MAEQERTVLEFYQLPTAFPSEWPAEKDAEDSSGDEDAQDPKLQHRKSRYQALERAASNRRSSHVPGSEGGNGSVSNLVQKDEPDPLGSASSVVQTLKAMGYRQVQDDARYRNRFLLSSTSFSPALFLSHVHANADTRTLLQGLDFLSQSIDQKSASLKVLVESNFERFVKAKATIDNVYKEMKYRGAESQHLHARPHSRHASRSSWRQSMNGQGLNNPLAAPMSDRRQKNALTKESEYGVRGIKAPLLDVSAKAEDVWGPALGGREKEENLKTVSAQLDRYKEYIELSPAIADSIKRKDYETLVEEYNRARKFADSARRLAESLQGDAPKDAHLYQILLAGRMWHDVNSQIHTFKRDVWKRLTSLHTLSKAEAAPGRGQDHHLELISLLLELGVSDNPVWVWLLSRYDYLKGKIQTTVERSTVEIEVLRRRLASAEKPTPHAIAAHLRSLGRQATEEKPASSDSTDVIELWDKMLGFLSSLLSTSGIIGEVVEFWNTVQGFIDGKAQRNLPAGYNGESRIHHQLSDKVVEDLKKGVIELVETIRDHTYEFFTGPPPEDISLLYSPLPPTPGSPSPSTPGASALTPTGLRDPRFNFDATNPPPPSPRRGESWEKLAFWPPWSNSLSGVYYLSKALALVGSGASDLAGLQPVAVGDSQIVERLKSLVAASRERCVTALCAAWNRDAENIKYVEDWQRSTELGDVTRMPSSFSAFEGTLLLGMQKILYISEAMSKSGAMDIVPPPPTKLLQMVRSQYVSTLYKALSGMVENAERSVKKADDAWAAESEWSTASPIAETLLSRSTLDAGDRNIRMLLTLSNLQALRSQVVPSLNSQFENAFSVKLTDESKTIRDVLGQIDARLFQSYTKKSIEQLRVIISAGLSRDDWVPAAGTRPTAAKPYVYETLLTLVLVHSQVSTTASSLTPQVLSFLLEQTSSQLLEAFRRRPKYPLEALMQATLDVEFVAQTLSHYTTDRASELQGQIYQELDSRTDNDARARLQSELPEMRSVLKKLREASKSEFACFKKPKRPGQNPSRTNSGLSGTSV
ncbi:exocyst complex component Sec5 [Emericellopsis atlantica]|uniref:Exocyst complex component SEC5 n=1 Tax=Emericellopsis atlantica TaxID=2614577 RepID=A0A9P7ZUH0_9HYPO|nr:exocyst complex component Sec5 [Emericellopsis atlantica]KAG9258036.1 exocyst complex component Sec5 [Emericellopsis atlantica]